MTDFLSSHSWIIWSIITIVLALLELSTGGFYIMCLAFGAFVVIPVSLFTSNIFILITVFCLASVFAMFFIKPALVKMNKKKNVKSNVSAIIGETGFVSEAIQENGYGRVNVAGDDWKAISCNGDPIPEGTKVEVIQQDSVIITVSKVQVKQNGEKVCLLAKNCK